MAASFPNQSLICSYSTQGQYKLQEQMVTNQDMPDSLQKA